MIYCYRVKLLGKGRYMKTQDDIVTFYQSVRKYDVLGFVGEVLLPFLSRRQVAQFLKEDADLSLWQESAIEISREFVLGEIKDYLPLAWEKVANHRGWSAVRTIAKMRGWLWLLEDEESGRFLDNVSNFAQYGAPMLAFICRKYGFPIPEGDELQRMIEGKLCVENCEMGCYVRLDFFLGGNNAK